MSEAREHFYAYPRGRNLPRTLEQDGQRIKWDGSKHPMTNVNRLEWKTARGGGRKFVITELLVKMGDWEDRMPLSRPITMEAGDTLVVSRGEAELTLWRG